MARTISIAESAPASRPYAPAVYAPGPAAEVAWQRIESWIAWRWGVRNCVFTVEGCGDWNAPLRPFVSSVTEVWLNDAWEALKLRPSPLGGFNLDSFGPFRISGTLGDAAEPPAAVKEAVFRLAEYMVYSAATPARERMASSIEISRSPLPHEPSEEIDRDKTRDLRIENPPNWVARAIQLSGAADLLRPWRNLGAA